MPTTPRRSRCAVCRRPVVACLCACIRAVDNRTPLLILQHPDEFGQTKGTVDLLVQCLSRVERRVGTSFAAPADLSGALLLYPATPDDARPAASAEWPEHVPRLLIAVDATWRKSRRVLHENPWMRTLPRLSLRTPPPSRYAIRQAETPDQRSTLEACAMALAQIDPDIDHAPLWAAMDSFVSLQQRLAQQHR